MQIHKPLSPIHGVSTLISQNKREGAMVPQGESNTLALIESIHDQCDVSIFWQYVMDSMAGVI